MSAETREARTRMSVVQLSACHAAQVLCLMVPRGLEPRTLRLLAVHSNQLSYETTGIHLRPCLFDLGGVHLICQPCSDSVTEWLR